MRFRFFPRAALGVLPLIAAGVLRAATDPLLPAWEETSRNLFQEAHARFADEEGREARLGEAATLLQLQPRTERNLRGAVALLSALVDESTDDDAGLTALYLLGRIEHAHRAVPDLEAAARHYRRLLTHRPDHPLAGQAAVKLAILELYRPRPAEERLELVSTFDALTRDLPDAAARRDLHLVLGEAVLRFELEPTLALDQFVAALEDGIVMPLLRADILVRVGELAREAGRVELARRSYRTFLADFPRAPRRLMIREALDALTDGSA